jgi:hypothetical protein
MKQIILGFFVFAAQLSYAQNNSHPTKEQQEIIKLSKDKWQWMSEKNVDSLNVLFDEKAKFVHMSGTWKKQEELDIIKTGRIWYKNAKVHDMVVEFFGTTVIVWSRITLEAIVRGSEAVTEFTVTEIYQKQQQHWKLLDLTFSSVRDTHQIQK